LPKICRLKYVKGVAAARLLLGRLAPGTANLTIPCSSVRIVINLSFSPNGEALLQRLLFPELPIKSNGESLGPKKVWLKILFIIETWIATQLEKDLSSLKMLREIYS